MNAGLKRIVPLLIFTFLCGPVQAARADAFRNNPEVEAFVAELVEKYQFDRRQLMRWFGDARIQQGVLKAMARPATGRAWYEYRSGQITDARIRAGLDYWQLHADTLARASAEYGVPEEIIVATIGLESFYGRGTGGSNVFDALATLAFAYPPRAELFRGELEQFLLLSRELKRAPSNAKGSYAGALGIAQFLPSSYRRYAVDYDGDGRRDLWSHGDAIGSIANYYQSFGWKPGGLVLVEIEHNTQTEDDSFTQLLNGGLLPNATVAEVKKSGATFAQAVPDDAKVSVFSALDDGGPRYWVGFNNFYVITRYNRSVNYALAIDMLAQELRRARSATQ